MNNPQIEMDSLDIRSILLLDNDMELSNMLKELLEERNFVVTVVENGVDGLREIMDMDFDVIICDLMMPQMPGDMFYYAVERAKNHLCDRFIFMTGYSGNPRVEKFLESAKGQALRKPLMIQDLVSAISLVLMPASRRDNAS